MDLVILFITIHTIIILIINYMNNVEIVFLIIKFRIGLNTYN